MATVAKPGAGITPEELRKATRNRGTPLEALALDVTPTGLHYLLAHFDIPFIDPTGWRLRVGGAVETTLDLDLAEIRAMPHTTVAVTMECAGNGRALMEPRPISQPWGLEAVSTAEWTGLPLRSLLDRVGITDRAVDIVFTGADRGVESRVEDQYRRALSVEEAADRDVLLAYEMNGRALEPQHGAPLRLVAPGWYGMASVKWLTAVEAVTEPFDGIQHRLYRYRSAESDKGEPVRLMRVRSLMIPPGIPEGLTRRRLLDAGPVMLEGRAWSGEADIVDVEVAVDGVWFGAHLDPVPVAPRAWWGWSWQWDAAKGDHELACRATDALGNIQPLAPEWNLEGFGNNAVQRVGVTVR